MTAPTPPPEAAAVFYTQGQAIVAAVLLALQNLWRQFDPANINGSFAAILQQMASVIAAGQVGAARQAAGYVPALLGELGMDNGQPQGAIRPAAFVGSSSGLTLAETLDTARLRALRTASQGGDPADAGLTLLTGIAKTQVADAARLATSTEIAVRPWVTGYVRMLNPPSCDRCILLAGKFYLWNAGFDRHPKCFPAGVVVSGPAVDAATRRWYDGELVVIRTASGKRLPVTGNHPILTGHGWVPARLLIEGDDVVSRASGDRAVGAVVPDQDQMPARIEDLWRPDGVGPLTRVPVAAEDFHGDGTGGQVDVVLSDSLLRRYIEPRLAEQLPQELLAVRAVASTALATLGATDQLGLGQFASSHRFMSGGDLLAEDLLRGVADSRMSRLAPAASLYPGVHQAAAYDLAADSERAGQGVLTLTRGIALQQILHVKDELSPRWDAPAGPLTVETRGAYASRGQDLLLRLASQVELDRVVDVARVQWSGHVYNLSSSEGWFDANGLIVSNCDCRHIPADEDTADDFRTDPDAYFRSLTEAEQDQAFGKARAQAIRDGADMGQVVNSKVGVQTAQVYGQRIKITPTGATSRGAFGRSMRDLAKRDGHRYRVSRTPRLTPESIYRIAKDRDDAVRLLRYYKYVL